MAQSPYITQYRHYSTRTIIRWAPQHNITPNEPIVNAENNATSEHLTIKGEGLAATPLVIANRYATLVENILSAVEATENKPQRYSQWREEAALLGRKLSEHQGGTQPLPTDTSQINTTEQTRIDDKRQSTIKVSEPAPAPPHPPVNVFVSTDAELEAVFVSRRLGAMSVGSNLSRARNSLTNASGSIEENHNVDSWATQQAIRVHLKIKKTHDGRQVPYSLLTSPTIVGADRWVELIGVESFPTSQPAENENAFHTSASSSASSGSPLVMIVGSLKALKSAQLVLKNIVLSPSFATVSILAAAQQQLGLAYATPQHLATRVVSQSSSSLPAPNSTLPCLEVCGGPMTTAHICNSMLCGGRDGIFCVGGARAIVSDGSVVALNLRGLFEGHRCSVIAVGSIILQNKFQFVLLGTYAGRGDAAPFETEREWLDKRDADAKASPSVSGKKHAQPTAATSQDSAVRANKKSYFGSFFSGSAGGEVAKIKHESEDNAQKSQLHKDHATVKYDSSHTVRRKERIQFLTSTNTLSSSQISESTNPPPPLPTTTIVHFAFSHNPVSDTYGALYNSDGSACTNVSEVDATAGLSEPGW